MSADHAAWFAKGEEDLAMVELAIAGQGPWPQICYHAQQLAEKYLKGFLVFRGTLPPRIHDLPLLLDHCMIHDPTLDALREECIVLTELGARARYPRWTEEPGEPEGRGAVAGAMRVRDAILQRVSR